MNPREIKRFLNNLIISYEVFVNVQGLKQEGERELFLKQLLLVQILNSRWRDVYKLTMSSDGNLLKELKPYIPYEVRNKLDLKSAPPILDLC